jgi:hypothetical protein
VEQVTTEKIHVCIIQQWTLHQWSWRLITTWKWCIVSGHAAIFTMFSLLIQIWQISQDVDNTPFSILAKNQQNGLKTNQTKGVWLKQCNGQDAVTSHLLSDINR